MRFQVKALRPGAGVTLLTVEALDETEATARLQREGAQVLSISAARTGLLTQVIGSQLKNDLGGMVSSQLLALGRNIYSKGLDQDDELEADRTGVALAARAGFDPYGLVAVLQQLRTAAPDDALFALSLSTHPPAQLRLNQLELAMGTRLDAYAGQSNITITQRLNTLAAVNRRPTAQVQVPATAPPTLPAKK